MHSLTQAQLISGADYRIIRRNGAVVPFSPSKVAYAMTKAFLALQGPTKAVPSGLTDAATAENAGAVASTGVDGDATGGGGGDGDDDGDGDGDGPRRSPSSSRNSPRFRAFKRSGKPTSQESDSARAHGRALTAFVLITALLLASALAFGLNGQRDLAEKVLGTFVSVATVAATLLRPK